MLCWLMVAFAADGSGLVTLAELPSKAQALRDNGLDAFEVRALLQVVQDSDLPRPEAVALIDHSALLVKEHGPISDFGAFVKTQLAEGKRGADLHGALTEAHTKADADAPEPAAEPDPEPEQAAPRPTPRPVPRPTRPRPSTKGKGYQRPSGTKGPGTTRTGVKGKGSSR